MARVTKKRQNYQAGKAGATQASQEKQDDGVTQGTPPGENHEDVDGNLIFMLAMPMTTLIMLIVPRTISVT